MYKLHLFQIEILRKLSKTTTLRFNELLIPNLESEHMNYHLKKLVDLGYVNKSNLNYSLTDSGKDYVGLLDDDVEIIEKQPKVSILLNIRRKNREGEIEHLLSKRLKQPYLGKIGRLTGKVKFGESIIESATRELYEETGLKAENDIKLVQIYHKIRRKEDNSVVQDNIFFIVSILNPTGDLIQQTPVQGNFWITKKELESNKELDLFDSLTLSDSDNPKDIWFNESIGISQGF